MQLIFQNSVGQSGFKLIDEQKNIIAELSGHNKLENGKTIPSRSTKEKRQLTNICPDLMKNLNFSPNLI